MGTSSTAYVLLLLSFLCTVSSAPIVDASTGTDSARYTVTSTPGVEEPSGKVNASTKSTVTSETRREYWKLKEIFWDVVNENNHQPCHVSTARTFHKFILTREEVDNVNLFEFSILLENYTYNPFWNVSGLFYKPWKWSTLRNHHGQTLLMLPFNYDVLSMKTLAIDVEKTNLELTDSPFGCFGILPTSQQVSAIRMILLSRIFNDKVPVNERLACNQEIISTGKYADFVYNCCYKDEENHMTCTTKADDVWINRMYVAIMCIKVLLFLVCARFIPKKAYTITSHIYEVPLNKPVKIIFKKRKIQEETPENEATEETENTELLTQNSRNENPITFNDIKHCKKFYDFLTKQFTPRSTELHAKILKLHIQVKSRKIVTQYDTRLGMKKLFYNSLKKCQVINNLKTSYTKLKMESSKSVKVIELLCRAITFVAIPFPIYIRLVFYYTFECEELDQRRGAMDANKLHENFKLYRTSIIQLLTPLHELFILTYIWYLLIFILGTFYFNFSKTLVKICKNSLRDMNSTHKKKKETKDTADKKRRLILVAKKIKNKCLPDKDTGFWKTLVIIVLIAPFYCVFVILSYTPTIYLTFKLIDKAFSNDEGKADKNDQNKKVLTHRIVTMVFMLFSLYSMAFLFSESIGFFIEVLAFVVMGIIINADNLLIYVSTVLLVFVYFYDCYSKIELEIGNCLIKEFSNMISIETAKDTKASESDKSKHRVLELQLNELTIASESDTESNKNKTTKNDLITKTTKGKIKWNLRKHMLFFDDSQLLRIPLRLFHQIFQDKIYGAPEQATRNLRNSTWQFLLIALFLAFILHVIIMFGKFYEMSSISSTLATVAGGMLPLLLKNMHAAKFGMTNLKAVKLLNNHIKNIIDNYQHKWLLDDIELEQMEQNVTTEHDYVMNMEADSPSHNNNNNNTETVNLLLETKNLKKKKAQKTTAL